MTTVSFSDLGLVEPILRALRAKNYVNPTPIQAQTIPHLLAGKDVLGIAQTGTGKTAAFALPILQQLAQRPPQSGLRTPRALVLAPTRELAIQIGEEFRAYGKYIEFRQTVIVGGVGQRPQVNGLRRGVDVVIATPGRLLDLINQGHARLGKASIMVLDEGDRMLDMGFIRDVRKIAAHLPKQRQSLLFSATMPDDVARLAGELLNHPVRIEVTPSATAVERIRQKVFFVGASDKRALLVRVLGDPALSRVIVFARTKRGADRVAKNLEQDGVSAEAIHGNKSQGARQRALKRFKDGQARVLVATDIASRGIDVDDVSHVINYELPNEPESYIHRIGRTARAGADGAAFSFCDSSERSYLRDIEKLTKGRIPVAEGHADSGGQSPARPKQRPGQARKAVHRKGNGNNTNPGRNPGGNARRKNRRPKKRAA